MDISLYISVLALIISIGVPFFEYIYNKSFNNINIEVSYYDEIYKDYLINKIPISRMKIQLSSQGEVLGIDQFLDLLREIRRNSLYFKFRNIEFYSEIFSLIQRLEDELVVAEAKMSVAQYNKLSVRIDSMINDIYEEIITTSRGKSVFDIF